jgi:RHS repeat-associated protein
MSTSNAVAVSAYAASKPWTTAATWNSYDGTNAWSTPGGDFSTTNSVPNYPVIAAPGWAHWYPTQIVQEWANGTLKNEGLLLADSTQGQTNDMLSFNSSKASSDQPYMSISWVPRGQEDPPFYNMQSFSIDDRAAMKVNVASGDLFVNSNDLAVKGVGQPIVLEHNYDSRNAEGGSVNPWYSLPGATVYEDGSLGIGINRYDYSAFIRKPDGTFLTPLGMDATLCAVNGTTCTANKADTNGATYALTFNHDGNGPLYKQGSKMTFGSTGGVLSDADRYGNTIVYHSGANGISSITDTQGRTFTRSFHELKGSFHVTSAWKESGTGGREVKYAYNSSDRLESYTDANAKLTKYDYNTQGELSELTDPKGNVTTFNYDSLRRITQITQPEVGGSHPTWKYGYFEGSDTEHGYTCSTTLSVTKKTVVTDPNGHQRTYCANAFDEVVQYFDSAGNASEESYNALGNTTLTTAASPGNGESGNVESLNYDEAGSNLLCIVAGTPSKESECPSSPSKSALVTSFSYKDEKNPHLATQVKNPQGNSRFSCYNEGVQKGSEGPACPSKASGPPGSVQNVTDQLSSQNELSFAFNPNGTISSSTDADGHATSYEYDASGNLKKITPPAGSGLEPTTITVDADSRPHVVTDGAGHIETFEYDKLDRITKIAYTGTGTARTVKYTYDANGNISKREDPTGTTKYTVDSLNRVTKEELPGALSNEYGYDAASNATSFKDAGGTTKYTHNSLNELESMLEPGESKETKFAYDNDHRLIKMTYPSGASENFKLEGTTGRPETITVEGVSGTTVPNLTYAYHQGESNTGLIQKLTESSGSSTSYEYDVLGRLASAVTTGTSPSRYAFAFDGAGNRTEQTVNPAGSTGGTTTYYSANSGNLLECRQTVAPPCSKNSATELSAYTFDGAGEQKEIVPKADTSGTTFAYNAAEQTSSLTPSGSGALALSYGGTVQDDLVSIGVSTTLQNSQLGLTREVSSAGTSYYARTPSGLLIDQRTPSGHFNPLFDGKGDIIGLVSSSGKVERTFRYGPYGENVKSEGTQTIPYPFGFKSGYRMPGGNVGLGNVSNGPYHFGQRYYDPTIGRWTQPDPLSKVSSPVQANRFAFAAEDPINRSDPSGRESFREEAAGWIEGAAEEGFEEAGEFGLTDEGAFVAGCGASVVYFATSGPYGWAAGCAIGGFIGVEGGDTTGLEG